MTKKYPALKHFLILISTLLALSCVSVPQASPIPPSLPGTPSTTSTTAYKFDLGQLVVSPAETEAGKPIRVQVLVKNTGARQNAYVGTLFVDGQEYNTQTTTLNPGDSNTLTFQVAGLGPGNHSLSIGGSSGNVRVYTVEKFEIVNTQIDIPRYTRFEYTQSPPLPHVSVQTFQAPATPFFVRQIDFRYPYPASFKILDINNKLLYSSNIAYAASAFVPDIQVGSDFIVQLETDQLAVDIRSEFFDFSSIAYVIAYYWPQVSTIDGIQKRFMP